MTQQRLPMRKIKDILRLKNEGLSHRNIARTLGVSAGAVGTTMSRCKQLGLTWNEVESFDEATLEKTLYGKTSNAQQSNVQFAPIDFAWLDKELSRPCVTIELLHAEYLAKHGGKGYKYSAFSAHYRKWRKTQRLSMRQTHKAGEKLFVDYSGKRPCIRDKDTNELRPVELFVAALGASKLVYAEASFRQDVESFIMSHVKAFEYFGGVTQIVVCDQLKSGVTAACKYEPGINRSYADMAKHMGTVIIPARPRKPKDKALVEVSVQIAQRWILARIRDEVFDSISDLNARIFELLEDLNNRPMRHYKISRRELFNELEKSALKPLPEHRYVYASWKKVKVHIDYHVVFDSHLYSVPYQYRGEVVEVYASSTLVSVYRQGIRVSVHHRAYGPPGKYVTEAAHMPPSHREHADWTPERFASWAQRDIGNSGHDFVLKMLKRRVVPEQTYRSVLGLISLRKSFGKERLEQACERALEIGTDSYKGVHNILKRGLENKVVEEEKPAIAHQNVRGSDYYKEEPLNVN